MNALENTITELQRAVKTQNNDLMIYGCHSMEFAISRTVLNTELETLKRCDFINDYSFSFDGNNEILALTLKMGGYNIRIYESRTEYFG